MVNVFPSMTRVRFSWQVMSRRRTKIYINLSFPELAAEYAALPVDGVGLMRAEFFALSLGKHPRQLLAEEGSTAFIECFSTGLKKVAEAFWPRPIIYRTLDLKSNEYRGLIGGERFEEEEENPMLGLRGCTRYVRDPECFRLELRAIKRAREAGYSNIQLMLPFVRFPRELEQCRILIEEEGLLTDGMELWMMAEVPSNVFLIEKFLPLVSGVSIGSNDLTQLILGIDRDNRRLATEFDERDEAVMLAMRQIVQACRAWGRPVSICGNAPSKYPELAAQLIEWGITSLSVFPEVFERTVDLVEKVEARLASG